MTVRRHRDPYPLLTLLPRLARGESNAQIAAETYLSLDGTKSRVSSLLHVMRATSRAHAVSLAHRSGLLDVDGELGPAAPTAARYLEQGLTTITVAEEDDL